MGRRNNDLDGLGVVGERKVDQEEGEHYFSLTLPSLSFFVLRW
jgi:hypothetical protein